MKRIIGLTTHLPGDIKCLSADPLEEADEMDILMELWINVFYDSNGDVVSAPSHADFDEAVIYADHGPNYAFSIRYHDDKVSIVDLTDAIREQRREVARERRHELAYSGAR
jgi:hypothetical protein